MVLRDAQAGLTAPLNGFVIELPFPPSVNSIWRMGRARTGKSYMYLTPLYARWKLQADKVMLGKMPKPVRGHFEVWITLDEDQRRGDADNYNKAVLDWLQRVELVDNDKLSDNVHVGWGKAALGCTVLVLPV